MVGSPDTAKTEFLLRQYFASAWGAATQHNPTYREHPGNAQANFFKTAMRCRVEQMVGEAYQTVVSQSAHLCNLKELQRFANALPGLKFLDGNCRISLVQKLLNTYLKFLWTAGRIPEPPHCPVDRMILKAAGVRNVSWVKLSTVEEYAKVIGQIHQKAFPKTLAQWELETFNEGTRPQ